MDGAPTVEDFGGAVLPNGVRFHGWRIETSDGPIASAAELKGLCARMQDVAGEEEKLPKLPEAVFLKNRLTMAHEPSGTTLTFDAEGAMMRWLQNSLVQGAGGLTVPAATLGSWKEKVQQQMQKTGDVSHREWDWTFSTDYGGVGAAHGAELAWAAHGGAGIDMALLRKREPILFYADLPLYLADLSDHGASEARVRIRVMPSCFFVLMRHWLRVDGVLVRQRDARFFLRFPPRATTSPATPPTLLRMRRLATAPLPPLPTTPPEPEGGRVVEGGDEDTPRPPHVPLPSVVPDEHASAEKLALVAPEEEVVHELVLTSAAPAGGSGATATATNAAAATAANATATTNSSSTDNGSTAPSVAALTIS
jgi:type 2A phosphatase activator TIP41